MSAQSAHESLLRLDSAQSALRINRPAQPVRLAPCSSVEVEGHTFIDRPGSHYIDGMGRRRIWQECSGCGNVNNRLAPFSMLKFTKPEIPARPDWAGDYYPPVAHRTRPRSGDAFFTLADLGMNGIDYVKAGR